jgi:hypothetical protein
MTVHNTVILLVLVARPGRGASQLWVQRRTAPNLD